MYGSQARNCISLHMTRFEKDVNMYGSQAAVSVSPSPMLFEKDVNMYGSQAFNVSGK